MTDALQAAITAGGPNAVVTLAPGVYSTRGVVASVPGQTLALTGVTLELRPEPGTAGVGNDVLRITAPGVTVLGAVIRGNRSIPSCGIRVVGTTDCTLEACTVSASGFDGIRVENSSASVIRCVVRDYGTEFTVGGELRIGMGIRLSAARDTIVRGCRVTNGIGSGIDVDAFSSRSIVAGCISRNNARNGIFVEESSSDTLVDGCIVEGNRRQGIAVNQQVNGWLAGCVIASCIVRGNGMHGIRIAANMPETRVTDVLVSGCHVSGNGRHLAELAETRWGSVMIAAAKQASVSLVRICGCHLDRPVMVSGQDIEWGQT